MANLKIADLKNYLRTLSNEELQNEIINLVKNYKEVKEYYTTKISPESENELLEKYKRIIKNEFFPDRGYGSMKYSVVNKAIRDFKKISNNVRNIADLMIYYPEIGVKFANIFGDIDEKFYRNIEKAYMEALEFIFKNDLEEEFKVKAKEIMEATDGIAWEFNDNMIEIYYQFYEVDDED